MTRISRDGEIRSPYVSFTETNVKFTVYQIAQSFIDIKGKHVNGTEPEFADRPISLEHAFQWLWILFLRNFQLNGHLSRYCRTVYSMCINQIMYVTTFWKYILWHEIFI